MDIDRARINGRFVVLEKNLKGLEQLRKLNYKELAKDYVRLEGCVYMIQTSIQALLDISSHIVARLGLRSPKGSKDIIKVLDENDLISKEKVKIYEKLVDFRNRVVYNYEEIDAKEVYKILHKNLPDIRNFIKDINRIIHKQ
ncbi:MAG: DUF86 domain-containing protein [bacterium]|nr:DUF86 domain-containing protein [bacterium]